MAKGVKRQQGFTAAEEQLLAVSSCFNDFINLNLKSKGFSRTTSGKGTAVFWIHAMYVAAIPIWIQTRIHQYSVSSFYYLKLEKINGLFTVDCRSFGLFDHWHHCAGHCPSIRLQECQICVKGKCPFFVQ